MSLSDLAGGLLSKLPNGVVGDMVAKALGPQVIQVALDQLNASGYGSKVNSWLGRGPNEPITAEQLREALGPEQINAIANQVGVPAETLSHILAEALPPAVEKAAQQGQVQSAQPGR